MVDFDVTKVHYGGLDVGEGAFQAAFNSLVGELEDLETKLNQEKTALWQGSAQAPTTSRERRGRPRRRAWPTSWR